MNSKQPDRANLIITIKNLHEAGIFSDVRLDSKKNKLMQNECTKRPLFIPAWQRL